MNRYAFLIIGAVFQIVLDQWSKIAMVDWLVPKGLPEKWGYIPSEVYTVSETWFKFRVVGNPGAAWGIFRDLPDAWRVHFFLVLTLAACAGITYAYKQATPAQTRVRWALMLVMGGAIGNLIDRLRIGYVIDFVEWFYGDFTWPNFNVADVGISVGVGLLLLDSLLARDDAPEAKPEAKPEPDPPPANG